MFHNFNHGICLLDTNIASALIKRDQNILKNVLDILHDGYCLSISEECYCELNNAPDILTELAKIFSDFKMILFKGYDSLRNTELKKYPAELSFEDCRYDKFIGLSSDDLLKEFHDHKLTKQCISITKDDQKIACDQLKEYISNMRSNTEIKSKEDFILCFFADHFFQYPDLTNRSPKFINDTKSQISNKDSSILMKIKTTYMQADFIYQKYIRSSQEIKPSDAMDIFNISCLPYVDLFLTENNNAEILKQIKKGSKLISALQIKTIRDLC